MPILTIDGLNFHWSTEPDEDIGAPWKEHDGHGIVSEMVNRPKYAGERVLVESRGWYRYYDFAETVKLALRDGWGVKDEKGKTKRQIATEAVEQDFARMKAWCNDEWSWVGVVVTLLDTDGKAIARPDCRASLWGMESDDDSYHLQVAKELAEEIAGRFTGKTEVCFAIR